MINHGVSDLCTRVRNGYLAEKEVVTVPNSKLNRSILDILKEQGFITNYSIKNIAEKSDLRHLVVSLKYTSKIPAVSSIVIVSKPGRRIYRKYSKIPKLNNGLGCVILSTSKGIITDFDAFERKIGGEILLKVF